MIDNNECDWKIICIDINDHEYEKYNDSDYLKKNKHDFISHFLKYYKIKDGKPPNKLAFNEQMLNSHTATTIIRNAHQEWLGCNSS